MRILKVMTILMIPVAIWLNVNAWQEYSDKQFPNVRFADLNSKAKKEVSCLAENIYYEAASESKEGKLAVAAVTLNRTKDDNFPSSICSVVKQKTGEVCQFSWVCENHNTARKDWDVYEECKRLALFVYINYGTRYNNTIDGALFYHADYVNPGWHNLKVVTKIDHHIFYRMKT